MFTNDVVDNGDGTFSYVNFRNSCHRRSYGFEALIRREITEHAYGWLSYTYSKTSVLNSSGNWEKTNFDQPHVLNAVASYKPGGGWELGARFQLASGRPTTPVIGATFDADCGCYTPVRGPLRSVRIPEPFDQLTQ